LTVFALINVVLIAVLWWLCRESLNVGQAA
jgi:hypothetical protein